VQIGWVLDYLADLESDFSRFHRIDDMYAMSGPRFMRFAWRIAAYDGMVSRRIEAQNHQPEAPVQRETAAPRRAPAPDRIAQLAPPGAKLVSATELAFLHPGLVEIRKAPQPAPE
jgi:hypothetical protein